MARNITITMDEEVLKSESFRGPTGFVGIGAVALRDSSTGG